jgi:NADPH2:quinone reductase
MLSSQAAFTVWANLFFDTQPLRTRESLLIQGGSSGIGSFAIQAAPKHRRERGRDCGSQEKCAIVVTRR